MGLLDDAIREHLDLKRRHGADPTEIERAEREALGPVRRAPEQLDEPVFDDELLPDPGLAAGEQHDEGWDELYDEPPLAPPAGPHEEPGDYLYEDPTVDHPLAAEGPLADSAAAAHTPPHPAFDEPSHAAGDTDQETVEYDVELEEHAHDDMLESTPEFLQDAPEHDRLWFEQRPPRDFDFDG